MSAELLTSARRSKRGLGKRPRQDTPALLTLGHEPKIQLLNSSRFSAYTYARGATGAT